MQMQVWTTPEQKKLFIVKPLDDSKRKCYLLSQMAEGVQNFGDAASVATKVAAFDADPSCAVPCLECGRAVDRAKVKTPDHMFCTEQHHRRFKAKTRAAGRDYGAVVKRAFRDVFHIARGFDYRGKEFRDDMPPLPDDVALLLAKTGAMDFSRLDEYQKREFDAATEAVKRGERPRLLFSGCRGNGIGRAVEKVS